MAVTSLGLHMNPGVPRLLLCSFKGILLLFIKKVFRLHIEGGDPLRIDIVVYFADVLVVVGFLVGRVLTELHPSCGKYRSSIVKDTLNKFALGNLHRSF